MTEQATGHGGVSGNSDDVAADDIPPGRPVRLEPTPSGLWRVVLGVGVAALAPLFGFLIGGILGAPKASANDPLFLALFVGIVIGGIGVIVAISGGVRLWRDSRERDIEEDKEDEASATGGATTAS